MYVSINSRLYVSRNGRFNVLYVYVSRNGRFNVLYVSRNGRFNVLYESRNGGFNVLYVSINGRFNVLLRGNTYVNWYLAPWLVHPPCIWRSRVQIPSVA